MLQIRREQLTQLRCICVHLALFASLLAPAVNLRAEPAIRILARAAYPPYSYLKDGAPVGLEVDVINAISEVLQRDIQIELVDSHQALERVATGAADALIGFPASAPPAAGWKHTRPLIAHEYGLFARTGVSTINGVDDLAGHSVGYVRNDVPGIVPLRGRDIRLVEFPDQRHALDALRAGEVNSLAADVTSTLNLLRSQWPSPVRRVGNPYASADSAIVLRADRTDLQRQLNEALEALDQDGTLSRLQRRWDPEHTLALSPQEFETLAELISLALGSVVLLGFSAWIITLRREVAWRRRAIDDLGASEKRFRVLVEHSPEGIIVWDEDAGRILDANPSMERITQFSRSELLQLPIANLFAPRSADASSGPTFGDYVEQALNGNTASFAAKLRAHSGAEVLCEVRLIRLPHERQRLVRASFVDISDRRRTEHALRLRQAQIESIFRGSPSGIGQTLSGKLTLVNQRFCDLLGYASEEILGRDLAPYFESAREYQRVHELALLQMRRSGSCQVESRMRRKDGKAIDVLLSMNPVFPGNLDGEVTVMLQDITERKKASTALEAAYGRQRLLSARLLDAQERERRRIALELHDEIGQAMTAIKLKLHSLNKRLRDAEAQAQLASCMEIADTALAQVRDLSLDLRPPQLDLMGLEAALRWLLQIRVEPAGIQAHLNANLGDAGRTAQIEISCFRVAQEALTNALRHARAQNIWVDIEQDDDTLEVTIRDDGVGFDTVAALDAAAAGHSMGLLSMEERLVLLGGNLKITSTPGSGTQVRGRIPLAYAAMEVAPIWGAD